MILTPRLKLRQICESDALEVIALLGEGDFMVYSPTGALYGARAKDRFTQLVKSYDGVGLGKLAVIEVSSGEVIGYCGIECCEIEGMRYFELGFRPRSNARGKGYATEAGLAVLRQAEAQGIMDVIAFTEPENYASICVLQKLGFHPYKQSYFSGMPIILFKQACNDHKHPAQ